MIPNPVYCHLNPTEVRIAVTQRTGHEMANHPQTMNSAEIKNTYNLLVAKLQGMLRDHVAELPTNYSIILQRILNEVRKKECSERYGLE